MDSGLEGTKFSLSPLQVHRAVPVRAVLAAVAAACMEVGSVFLNMARIIPLLKAAALGAAGISALPR
jgi:hypothetical protein